MEPSSTVHGRFVSAKICSYTWFVLTSYQPPLLRTVLLCPYLLQHIFHTIKFVLLSKPCQEDKFDGAKCMLQEVQTQEHGTEHWRLVRCCMTPLAWHVYRQVVARSSVVISRFWSNMQTDREPSVCNQLGSRQLMGRSAPKLQHDHVRQV
ncbi:unnamed protein product [Ixodes pacificus]